MTRRSGGEDGVLHVDGVVRAGGREEKQSPQELESAWRQRALNGPQGPIDDDEPPGE
jgi:hypothetical protein